MNEIEQWFGKFNHSFNSIHSSVADAIPSILSFVSIIFVGFVISLILQKTIYRILLKTNSVVKGYLSLPSAKMPLFPKHVVYIISKSIFWLTFAFFFILALHFTGFQKIDLGLDKLFYFVPQIVAAVVLLFVGWFISLHAESLLLSFSHKENLRQGPYLSSGAKWLILIIFFDLALMQLGIKTSVISNLIVIIVAAFLGSLMLSFALGSREHISDLIACQNLKRLYEVGQKVRLESIEGIILKFTSTGVILLTKQGQVFIPAKKFTQESSILLGKGGKK